MNLEWKCHTPNLLKEVMSNHGTEALAKPLEIFGHLLHRVAQRAAELNDPELNILMLRLTLYDAADPEIHSHDQIVAAFASQADRLPPQPLT